MIADPLLSVCVITYNHEKYITQTLESLLMQKTTFPFDIVIGEDCSADNTRKICEQFAEKNSQIKILPRSKNLGMLDNFKQTFLACKGKYVALCEGDDFWINTLKLQQQVSFLEKNPAFSFCFHKGFELDEENGSFSDEPNFTKNTYTFKDFGQQGCFIKTMSVVLKKDNIDVTILNTDWFYKLSGADHLFYLMLSMKGKAHAFNEHMGVYRRHDGGVWSGISVVKQLYLLEKDIYYYRKYLPINSLQKLNLNWQLKIILSGLLYQKWPKTLVNKLLLIIINRIIFIFGPGYISGIMAFIWYKLEKTRLKLYEEHP